MSLLKIKRRAESTTYEEETFRGLDLRSMKAFGASFRRCAFQDCQLDLSDLRTSRFDGCTFERCELSKVDFSTSFIEGSRFLNCNLEQASFMGCFLRDVDFISCRMAYGETMFLNATAKSNLSFVKCNLHGSNLDMREAEAGVVRFEHSNLWGARVGFGCSFWNAEFDEVTCRRFIAMVARVYPGKDLKAQLIAFAGDQYPVVERVMGEAKT